MTRWSLFHVKRAKTYENSCRSTPCVDRELSKNLFPREYGRRHLVFLQKKNGTTLPPGEQLLQHSGHAGSWHDYNPNHHKYDHHLLEFFRETSTIVVLPIYINVPMNLWHDVEPGTKDDMNVIVEIPRGSKNKYEIDKETGLIALDRAMHTAQDYPFDYGFVPRSYWDDEDALDVLILTTNPLSPGILVRVRPVAVMKMVDDGESDNKIIGVPVKDPRWDEVQDLKDINKHTIKEIEHFFATYKKIQNKEVEVQGFEGKEAAQADFERSLTLYQEKYGDK